MENLKTSDDSPDLRDLSLGDDDGGGRGRGVSVTVPPEFKPGIMFVQTPDGRTGEVELPKDAAPGQTLTLNMKAYDSGGDRVVELVRPTPDTKLGLTFGEFRGQVVIHQVFPGYPAENLRAGDFVHAVNGTPVTAEAAATQLASKTGDRLKLRLRAPPGCQTVTFDKAGPDAVVGIDLNFDTPSGRVRIENIHPNTAAKACDDLAVGDVLLAVNGVRAVDVETAVAVLRMVESKVELRVLRYGGEMEVVSLTKPAKSADLGLVLLSASTGQCVVARVVPGSAAALTRAVWVGDVLESVNMRAISLGRTSADEARTLLMEADGSVALGIRRPQEGEGHAKEATLSRPTPDTKLGLTLTDLGEGQVVIHQVYEGYKAACLQAADFVISVNGHLVDTEPQATQIAASSTGDLHLQLRSPVGARSVWMKKEDPSSAHGIEFDDHAPSGLVLIKRIMPAFPAAGNVVPAVGDILLAVNGVRAADTALANDVLKASAGLVDLRIIHYGALPALAMPLGRGSAGGAASGKRGSVTLSQRGSLIVSGDI